MAQWSLLDDVVDVPVLTHLDIDTSVSLDAFDGCLIDATLVDGDLLWHVVQVDGTFQQSAGSSHIWFGSQQKVYRIASPAEVVPPTFHFDVSFVHLPTLAKRVLAPTKFVAQHRHHLDYSMMHSSVDAENTASPATSPQCDADADLADSPHTSAHMSITSKG